MNDFPSAYEFDLHALTSGRKLAIYGAGFLYEQVRKLFPGLKPDLIIDDELGRRGAVTGGIPITPFDRIASFGPGEFFVLICAYVNTGVRAIRTRLAALGFRFPVDVVDASILLWPSMERRLQSLDVTAEEGLFQAIHSLSMEIPIRNESSPAGTSLFAHLIKSCVSRAEGNICEFGVYQGGNALVVTALLHALLAGRKYHMLDSFQGFQGVGTEDPASRAADFTDNDWEAVRSRFALIRPIHIWKGMFHQTLPQLASEKLSMAYIDCDLYEPALECLGFVRERLSPGGMILAHDYVPPSWEYPAFIRQPFRGVAKAVDEFVAETHWRRIVFPETTHVVLTPPGN